LAALARLSPASRRPCATFVLAECHRLLPHRQRQQERLVRLLWPLQHPWHLSPLPHPLPQRQQDKARQQPCSTIGCKQVAPKNLAQEETYSALSTDERKQLLTLILNCS
jgi:hypothetical protein